MIIKVIDELRDYSYIKIREKSLLQNIKDSSFIAQFVQVLCLYLILLRKEKIY